MKFISGEAISQEIKSINLRKIAVAYLGWDWASYVTSPDDLEAIVISPTVGSNPAAVLELVAELSSKGKSGWERVHFLDQLHAKVYIGQNACVIGSANLSTNGLSGKRLVEAAVLTVDATLVASANEFFDNAMKMAKGRYKDEASKVHRLEQLFHEHNLSLSVAKTINRMDDGRRLEAPKIQDIVGAAPQFQICFYVRDEASIKPELEHELGNSVVKEQFRFHPDDTIAKGEWLLTWPLTKEGKWKRKATPKWMFVDRVQADGMDLKENPTCQYTTVAFQWDRPKDEWTALLSNAPFQIDKAFSAAMAQILQNDIEIHDALVQPGRDTSVPWRLNLATARATDLFNSVREHLRGAADNANDVEPAST